MEILLKDNRHHDTWFTFFTDDEELITFQKEYITDVMEYSDFQKLIPEIPYTMIIQNANGDYVVDRKQLLEQVFIENDLNDLYELFGNYVYDISELSDHVSESIAGDLTSGKYLYFIY
jgi:hypothetical protein